MGGGGTACSGPCRMLSLDLKSITKLCVRKLCSTQNMLLMLLTFCNKLKVQKDRKNVSWECSLPCSFLLPVRDNNRALAHDMTSQSRKNGRG